MNNTGFNLSLAEMLSFPMVIVRTLIRVLYTVLTPWSQPNHKKTLYQLLTDSFTRYIVEEMTVPQIRAAVGTSWNAYSSWAKKNRIQPVVDNIEDCRIFWLGSRKKSGRIVIYCHGGAFITPLLSSSCVYWHSIKRKFEKVHGKDIGVAILEYSVWPATFPTQLHQLVHAVNHILETGVKPSNLFLSGDSAGANIVLQFLSHVLHPIPTSPISAMSSRAEPFGGVILQSPWISFSGDTDSHRLYGNMDIVNTDILRKWGNAYLAPVADSQHIYAQVNTAPPNWFGGIPDLVKRMFITAGENEIMRDDIVSLSDTLFKISPRSVRLEIEEDGVHNESIYGSMVGSTKCRTHQKLVEWLGETSSP